LRLKRFPQKLDAVLQNQIFAGEFRAVTAVGLRKFQGGAAIAMIKVSPK
jgi:hypothetical protein